MADSIWRELNLRNCIRRMYDVLKIYCAKSSLHGMRYVGDPFRMHLERALWAIAIIFQSYGCYQFIQVILSAWFKSPIILTYNSHSVPVSEVNECERSNLCWFQIAQFIMLAFFQ